MMASKTLKISPVGKSLDDSQGKITPEKLNKRIVKLQKKQEKALL